MGFSMKCKQAEKIIIDASQTEFDPGIKTELDNHVLNCLRCSSFKKNFNQIRQEISEIHVPQPSVELLEKAIALCHDELMEQSEIFVLEKSHADAIKVPQFVWAAFAALLVLMIVWAVPVIRAVVKSQTLTMQAILVIIIIIQNLFMLIFSPVLLRTLKLKSYDINFQY